MTEPSNEETVTLRSKDGKEFRVSTEAARLSDLVKDALLDDEGGEVTLVDVLRVSSDCLEEVVSFLSHYQEEKMTDIPTPLNGTSFAEIVTQTWYRDFVESKEREVIFDLLTAANYMGIKPLLDLTCLKVTFELTGKTAEEIREILNLPALTPEEEATARVEHKWIFEDS
jgi:S-phase kinase-associated protein 1